MATTKNELLKEQCKLIKIFAGDLCDKIRSAEISHITLANTLSPKKDNYTYGGYKIKIGDHPDSIHLSLYIYPWREEYPYKEEILVGWFGISGRIKRMDRFINSLSHKNKPTIINNNDSLHKTKLFPKHAGEFITAANSYCYKYAGVYVEINRKNPTIAETTQNAFTLYRDLFS